MRKKVFTLLIFFAFGFYTGNAQSGFHLITSFEEGYPMKDISTTKGVKTVQTTDFAAVGRYALNAQFPAKGGSVVVKNLPFSNWQVYDEDQTFLIFIWATELGDIDLTFSDSTRKTYAEKFPLKRGVNHLQVRLDKLQKEGVNIRRMASFAVATGKSNSLYMDYVGIDNFQPALATLGRYDIKYSDQVVTRHFPWGNPLAGGAINAYSISPVGDGRGIIELGERLQMNNTVTSIGRSDGINRWGFGGFYARRSLQHREYGNPYALAFDYIADDLLYGPQYDVIIWPGIHAWTDYPKVIRDNVLERVKNGTGLVLLVPIDSSGIPQSLWDFSPLKPQKDFGIRFIDAPKVGSVIKYADSSSWEKTEDHFITHGIPFNAFPFKSMGVLPYNNNGGEVLIKTQKGNPVLSVSKYGKGRVVAFAYQNYGLIPEVADPWETGLNFDYWEYMWSLLGRSVLWASNREPHQRIDEADWDNGNGTIRLKYRDVNAGVSARIQILDDYGIEEKNISVRLPSGTGVNEIKIGNDLHGGKQIARIQLVTGNEVVDWYSFDFETPQKATISSIALEEEMIPVGDTLKGKVSVAGDVGMVKNIRVKLIDNYNRLISEQTPLVVGTNNEVAFNLPTRGVLSHLAHVDVTISDQNNKQIDHERKEAFILLNKPWNDFKITMYGFNPPPIPGTWEALDSQMQRINVTTLAAYPLSTSKHSNYSSMASARIPGVESTPYFEEIKNKYIESGDKMVLKRKPDLMDPLYLDTVQKVLKERIGIWKKFSPDAYYIFEEASATDHGGVLDLSFSELSLNAMRNWLKLQYGTLEALNHQWGTDFKIWEQVIPDDYKEAQARGNYSSWADHATFTEKSWIDLLRMVQQTTYRYDKNGLVQLSGTQESVPFNGYDYSLLDKYVDQMNTYDLGNQLHYHRNFNPSLKLSGGAGYGRLGKGVLYEYYNNLFLGETDGAYIFWQFSAVQPDLTLSPGGEFMRKGFDEIKKGGIAKLIGSFKSENENKIAIHYSMPSIHAAWIPDGIIKKGNPWDNFSNTWHQYDRNRDGWVKALQDAGLGFDFISYGSVEDGGLINKGYKVLILPMSMALSDREIRQIEYFVDHGGILIADALPGIMDNHAKFRERRALSEVFGINSRTYSPKEIVTPKSEMGLMPEGARKLMKDNPSDQLFLHNYGQGKAYLLNYFLDDYAQQKLDGENGPALNKIRALLDNAGVHPSITMTTLNGQPVMGVSKYVFEKDGTNARLLGLLPDKNRKTEEILVQLDREQNIYDVRNRRYLGRNKEIKLKVEERLPILIMLTDEKIENLSANGPEQTKRGEQVELEIFLSGEKPDSKIASTVLVEVINPDGKNQKIYNDNVGINDGKGVFRFRTALNDLPGKWTIKFTDVASGLAFQKLLQVL